MGRAPCCDKDKVKKGPWSLEEDEKLKSHIEKNGTGGNWIALPQKIGLRRCGKSCRLRWLNYLRPNIKHGGFSEEEDNIICSLYNSIGSRWSTIAAQLPGRTDNDIKNYWNTRLKKKLLGKPRKDQQHGQRAVRRSRQEGNRAEIRNLPAAAHETSQTPYCPHPPIYPKQDDRAAADSHGSIRKLLVGLGERFSHHDTLSVQRPLGFPSSSQHLHEKSPSLIAPSSSGNPFNESSSPVLVEHTLQAAIGSFTTELDEMFYGNQMKLKEELDGICGVSGNILSECNTSSSPESLSWNEVIPLMQQEQQQCLLEELVHFGTQ